MELCVVSGKGGTGKTTVSVGLTVALGSLAGLLRRLSRRARSP